MKKMGIVWLLLLLSACGGPDAQTVSAPTPSTGSPWEAPDSYRFDVRSTCGERSFIGHFRITVDDDEVANVDALDDSAKASVNYMDEFPTLLDLLDEAENARSSDADVVEVETNDVGRPTHIEIDHNEEAIDDEACYEITRYKEN